MNYRLINKQATLKMSECVQDMSGNCKPAVYHLHRSEQGCKQLLLEGSIRSRVTGSDLRRWSELSVLTAADVLRVTRRKDQTLTTLMCPYTDSLKETNYPGSTEGFASLHLCT